MSDFKFLNVQDSNGVMTVTMDRPEKRNAFNSELIEELTHCFDVLGHDQNCRLIILTGAGKAFSAGADLNWMKSMKDYSEEENIKDSRKLAKMFQTINDCPKPVIGAINGHALGGGVGLVSVVDYALCVDQAKLGFTEVRLGLIPAVISPFVMQKIGETHARAWFLSGAMFQADKALTMGLVHEVVKSENLQSRLKELSTEFLKAGPKATQLAKSLIRKVHSFDDQQGFTCHEIARVRVSEEGQHGMECLLEKKAPRWVSE